MAEHKHAAVLRAIADGKAVQWRLYTEWNDYKDSEQGNPLYCMADTEWRIKPEPKPDVVRYLNTYQGEWGGLYLSEQHAKENADHRTKTGMFRITFDGETGKLKSAEVLE
jgi:hypothetical protein